MKPYFYYFKQDLPKKEGNNKGFEIISSLTVTKSVKWLMFKTGRQFLLQLENVGKNIVNF